MKRTLLAFVLFMVATGCQPSVAPNASSSSQASPEDSIAVIATVGMVADVVRHVGGEHVEVSQIMGAGVDPHLYKATRDDGVRIANADVVFYCGLMLEGKMADTLVKIARRKPVIAVTELLDDSHLLEPADFQGHYDPHVWMDVSAWSRCVDVVVVELSDYAPQHASDFEANGKQYQETLASLHQYGLDSIGSIPEASRVLVTSHDAFNYFGRAYGLDVLGVQGLSTESEAGLQRINDLVDLLVAKKIQAVFVESSVSRKNIQSLVEGAASRGHQVRIGGELFSDAMGAHGSYEGTYVGMLDHNITLVTRGLGGNAPEKGYNGKLTTAE